MRSYKIVTYFWRDHELHRGETYDGFATPMDAMITLGEQMAQRGDFMGVVQAYCLDEDTGEEQWRLEIR